MACQCLVFLSLGGIVPPLQMQSIYFLAIFIRKAQLKLFCFQLLLPCWVFDIENFDQILVLLLLLNFVQYSCLIHCMCFMGLKSSSKGTKKNKKEKKWKRNIVWTSEFLFDMLKCPPEQKFWI